MTRLGERQRRLDTLQRELARTRTRAAMAMRTARLLRDLWHDDENEHKAELKERINMSELRYRILVARVGDIERQLDQIAVSLAKRPPKSVVIENAYEEAPK